MKRIVILLVLLQAMQMLVAQEMSIVNYSCSPNDSMAYIQPRYDRNNSICALVVFRLQDIGDVVVKGSYVVDSEKHEDSILVYLANGAKIITIYHQDYLTKTVSLADVFGEKKGVIGGKTYVITLCGTDVTKKEISKETNYIWIESDVPLSEFIINKESWPVHDKKKYSRLLPCGNYQYRASAIGYADIEGSVSVIMSFEPAMIQLKFNTTNNETHN